MLNNKYEILNYIASGNYGTIYKACHNKKLVVLKESSKIEELKYEASVYNELRNVKNIARFFDFFIENNKSYLVIEYYNKTLYDFKEKYFTSINYYSTLLSIFKTLYSTLLHIHNNNYLHRDLKPLNICLDEYNNPIIIDFGLSKKYMIDNKHIAVKTIKCIIGSYAFCSINVENMLEPSRRDDLESLFYIFVYCLIKKSEEQHLIKIKKDISIIKENSFLINEDYYSVVKQIHGYIRKMTFTQKPNYNYIIDLFRIIE
jgi:serine/threonine protein kinase